MLLYGASGHAKVIISCLIANQIPIMGIFDDDLSKTSLWDIPVVGSYKAEYESQESIIVAIGNNKIRQKVAMMIRHSFGKTIHPSAIVDPTVQIGEGTIVLHQSVIQADAQVGKHVIVNTAASIDHECRIGDFVHIAPKATLCGNVSIGQGTLVGAGSIVCPNLTIGKGCLIAAGSVITKNIPDFAVVRGNPAKVLKIIDA